MKYNRKLNIYCNILNSHKIFYYKKFYVKKLIIIMNVIYLTFILQYDYRFRIRHDILINLIDLFYYILNYVKKLKFIFLMFIIFLIFVISLNWRFVIYLSYIQVENVEKKKYLINLDLDFILFIFYLLRSLKFILYDYVYYIFKILNVFFLLYKFIKFWFLNRGTKMGLYYKKKIKKHVYFYFLKHFEREKYDPDYAEKVTFSKYMIYSAKGDIFLIRFYDVFFFLSCIFIYPFVYLRFILKCFLLYNIKSKYLKLEPIVLNKDEDEDEDEELKKYKLQKNYIIIDLKIKLIKVLVNEHLQFFDSFFIYDKKFNLKKKEHDEFIDNYLDNFIMNKLKLSYFKPKFIYEVKI